ncbi:hypothetical protein ACEE90_00455 [Corynebacterium phoceense]
MTPSATSIPNWLELGALLTGEVSERWQRIRERADATSFTAPHRKHPRATN